MQRINLDALNVRRLNFTDNTIYRLGRPLYLIPTDASGAAHACVQTMGIGPNACPPTYPLDVDGNIMVRGGAIYFDNDTNEAIRTKDVGGNYMQFDTAGKIRMHIDNNGDVGIGTIVPAAILHVKSQTTGATSGTILENDSSGSTILTIKDISATAMFSGDGDYFNMRCTKGDGLAFSGEEHYFGDNAHMFILDTGYVGIGTNDPSGTLHVKSQPGGTILENAVSGTTILKIKDPLAEVQFSSDGGYFNMRSTFGDGLAFGGIQGAYHDPPDHLAHMYINEYGYVGIGTDNPDKLLDVSGNMKVRGGNIYLGTGNDVSIEGSDYNYLQFKTSGAIRMYINLDGYVGIGTKTPSQLLDISGGKVFIHGTGAGLDVSGGKVFIYGTDAGLDISGENCYIRGTNAGLDISGGKVIIQADISGTTTYLDMSCNDISNVNILHFCDDSSISSGSSLTISTTAIHFDISNNLHALDISYNGYVGIGTQFPLQPLDISGNMRVRGNIVDSHGQLGSSSKALSSDTNGGIVWKDRHFINENSKDKLAVTLNAGWGSTTFNPGMNFKMSSNYSYYDLGSLTSEATGFKGASFDGTYIYFTSPYFKKFVRYNTTENFDMPSSYDCFDLTPVTNASATYSGSVFDGRYIYLIPRNDNSLTRYDTTAAFDASGSYDVKLMNNNVYGAHSSGIFDGKYLYISPNSTNNDSMIRYDTEGGGTGFQNDENYIDFIVTGINPNVTKLIAGVFTGRYIYFISANEYGSIIKYDTEAGIFNNTSSYQYRATVDGGNVDSKEFSSGVFDGRYLYLIPGGDILGQITRYDTLSDLTENKSYSYYNTADGNAESKGFNGGAFDGRYLYLVPYLNDVEFHGQITRYDTTAVFTDSNSYRFFDTTDTGASSASDSIGFGGCIFDDTYLYFVPLNGTQITRYNTGGPTAQQGIAQLANSSNFYLDSSGNVGIGTDAPSQLLDVSGNVNIKSKLYFSDDTSASISGSGTNLQFDTSGNNRMLIDSAGNVGIGTGDPKYPLDISGNMMVGDGTIYFNNGENEAIRTKDDGGFYMQFDTDGKTRMNIDSDGNVGINTGIAPPLEKLDISGGKVIIRGTGAGLDVSGGKVIIRGTGAGLDVSGGKVIIRGTGAGLDMSNNDISNVKIIYFHDTPSASISGSGTDLQFDTNGNTRMHINNLGNVGIGAAPASDMLLDVSGNMKVRGGNIYLGGQAGSNDVSIEGSADSNYLSFITNAPTEAMRIISTGYVGIGTTPSSTLHVLGVDDSYAMQVFSGGANNMLKLIDDTNYNVGCDFIGDGDYFTMRCVTGNGLAFGGASGGYGSNAHMYILASGNVGIGTYTPGFPLEVAGDGVDSASYGTYIATDATFGPFTDPASSIDHHTVVKSSTDSRPISIKAEKGIWSGYALMISSDSRIKENIVEVPDNLALQQVRDIECKYYEYKDKISKGTAKTIGFIAQQVKEVLPMAVSIQTNIIPNEMRMATDISWNKFGDKYKCTIHDLSDNSGNQLYRFYVSNISDADISANNSDNKEVKKEVRSLNDDPKSFIFDTSYNRVFIYGKQVHDFHTLDKSKIFSLHHSAIQELDKLLVAERAKTSTLETTVAALIARLDILESNS